MVSLKSRAYDYIQAKITAGRGPAGITLSCRTLAEEMGISRTPVREALRQLEGDGLVIQIPRLGTVVRVPSREELVELYDLRLMLETYAIRRAARCANNDEHMRQLDSVLDGMEVIGKRLLKDPQVFHEPSWQEWTMADRKFHSLLLEAGRAPWMRRVVDNLRCLTSTTGPQVINSEEVELVTVGLREHRQIVQALRKSDAKAAEVTMAKHIGRAKKRRLDIFDSGQRPTWPKPEWDGVAQQLIREIEQ